MAHGFRKLSSDEKSASLPFIVDHTDCRRLEIPDYSNYGHRQLRRVASDDRWKKHDRQESNRLINDFVDEHNYNEDGESSNTYLEIGNIRQRYPSDPTDTKKPTMREHNWISEKSKHNTLKSDSVFPTCPRKPQRNMHKLYNPLQSRNTVMITGNLPERTRKLSESTGEMKDLFEGTYDLHQCSNSLPKTNPSCVFPKINSPSSVSSTEDTFSYDRRDQLPHIGTDHTPKYTICPEDTKDPLEQAHNLYQQENHPTHLSNLQASKLPSLCWNKTHAADKSEKGLPPILNSKSQSPIFDNIKPTPKSISHRPIFTDISSEQYLTPQRPVTVDVLPSISPKKRVLKISSSCTIKVSSSSHTLFGDMLSKVKEKCSSDADLFWYCKEENNNTHNVKADQ